MLLLRTVHGSHLYGLNHKDSDYDTFEVYENQIGRIKARNAKQSITDDDDVVRTDLSTFMLYATKGVPQYLEAMWSTMADVDHISDMRYAFQPDLYETERTYVRTIKNFVKEGSYKRRRHAWRLHLNLSELHGTGQFNPTLTGVQANLISYLGRAGSIPPEARGLTHWPPHVNLEVYNRRNYEST